jgi:hypothetical protein
MLGLSVNKFFHLRPKLPFRFKTEFFTGNEQLDKMLGISLTNITLPKMEGQASEGSLYLGNTIYTIPVWKIGSRKLEITFEETDKMVISKFIDRDLYLSYGQSPYRISIAIHHFDEHLYYNNIKDRNNDKKNYQSTLYICHLSSYSEPQFKRSGSANQVTMTATFIIDAEIKNWDGSTTDIVIGQVKSNEESQYDQEITKDDFGESYNENYQRKYEKGTGYSSGGGSGSNTSNIDPSGGTTKDFNVSQKETDDVFAKIQQSPYKDKVSKEDLQAVQIENAKRMEKAYGEFERLMKENGYNVSINAYNDTGHELGIGTESGSHLLGQKIDLTMMDKNNNKLTPSNMKQEDLDKIVELAHQAGLTPNWETTGKTGSGWGDFALAEAKSIDKQGNVVDLTTRTWTGEKTAYNTGSKSYQGMGNA